MADSFKSIREEIDRFVAAATELAPGEKFGNISLADLQAVKTGLDTDDATVAQNEATLEASQDTRKTNYKAAAKKLELYKNGVIGNEQFGPDSPLYGAMGFKRTSERASGLTRKRKQP